jgi:hypothetical protein
MFLLLVAKLSLQERAGLVCRNFGTMAMKISTILLSSTFELIVLVPALQNSKLKVIHHLRLTPTDFAPVAWEANGLNPGTVSLFP